MISDVLPLEAGMWPIEPVETGYVGGSRTRRYAAPFEGAGCVRAELEQRLETTGEAGEALIDEVQSGIEDYELLSRPARRVLNYISSGPKRRKQTYAEWKSHRKYKHKRTDMSPNPLKP